ncbi:AarF/ABC1/UbiB kinase family protein [Flammeovirga sp. EKP202]|uniref:ABC1 kinase family protein n=1 Tax=Flammeovirga sp. EKP202 TaxID=2770592 RepID=UPI00165F5BA5|nr:AarF/UbiB family protein [Flammeovirga sp. EKP202]MBD0402874.1 AarF/ABC1/UbiB kinase family protein [Flammeovirga sp. EKP202]
MQAKTTYSNRYIEIVQVMVKYGFQSWLINSSISHLIPNKILDRHLDVSREPIEVRFRLAIEELGPTFIKLGQMLSNRADLIPIEYVKELKKLQDEVKQDDSFKVEEVIKEELGEEEFATFNKINDKPLGIASIGQTYAVERNNKPLVLKVRKPSASATVNEDLRIIRSILRIVTRSSKNIAKMDPLRLFDEFEITLKNELNYSIEKRNQEQFYNYFKHSKTTTAPKVIKELCTDKVLCMEFADGTKMNDFLLKATDHQKEVISRNLVKSFFQQIIEYGFYHADPHPGNIFITKDLKLCFIDFGIVGHLLKEDTTVIGEFLEAFLSKNTDRVIHSIKRIALTHEITKENRKNLQYQLHDLFQFLDQDVSTIPWASFTEKVMTIMFGYNIKLPNYFVTLAKALALVLGTALEINPKMNLLKEIKPFILKYQMHFLTSKGQRELLLDLVYGIRDFKSFPTDIKEIIALIKKGKIDVMITLEETQPILDSFRNGINKLTIGIIIGCLLIASSSMAVAENATFINKFAIGGYVIAGILGLALTIDVFKDLFRDKPKRNR